jgi:hypothetical protein
MEHRFGTRFTTSVPVLMLTNEQLLEVRILDVSLSGALVRSQEPLQAPSIVWLALPGARGDVSWERALVVRTIAGGAGLEWLEGPDAERLRRLRRAGPPVRAAGRRRPATPLPEARHARDWPPPARTAAPSRAAGSSPPAP